MHRVRHVAVAIRIFITVRGLSHACSPSPEQLASNLAAVGPLAVVPNCLYRSQTVKVRSRMVTSHECTLTRFTPSAHHSLSAYSSMSDLRAYNAHASLRSAFHVSSSSS